MAEIRRVRVAQIRDARELLEEYAAECSLQELAPTNPQREMYAAMERSGNFQCFGVFVGDWLVGFAIVLTYVVPHYGRKAAVAESLFLGSAHRHGRMGIELIQAVESHAREQGCVATILTAPAGSKLERLLGRLKPYRHSNTAFVRSL